MYSDPRTTLTSYLCADSYVCPNPFFSILLESFGRLRLKRVITDYLQGREHPNYREAVPLLNCLLQPTYIPLQFISIPSPNNPPRDPNLPYAQHLSWRQQSTR